MNQTKLLDYLIKKLKENGIIQYNKDFLTFIEIQTDSTHIKRLSDYLHRTKSIRDVTFLKAIEEKLGLDASIWEVCESSQVARIKESIQKVLSLQKLPGEEALELSTLILIEYPINTIQKNELLLFKTLTSKKAIEEKIDALLKSGLLNKNIKNQEFLVVLLKLSYDKGLYSIIVEFILPNLFISYRQRPDIEKLEAHTHGSLKQYDEAKHILYQLVHHSNIENSNLRTSALSNHKRALLLSNKLIKKEDISLLIEGYEKLHAMEGIYSYYTGINLLYMVMLSQLTFPKENKFFDIDITEIYKRSKPSLKADKTHDEYYVTMSELEFKLLLGYKGILKEIEFFLDNKQPHISLVERTFRQIQLFVNVTAKSQDTIVRLLRSTINLLESYIKFSNKSSPTS